MRQQENKKENFRENPTKLTWIPKVYNYAARTGNLKAEAVGRHCLYKYKAGCQVLCRWLVS